MMKNNQSKPNEPRSSVRAASPIAKTTNRDPRLEFALAVALGIFAATTTAGAQEIRSNFENGTMQGWTFIGDVAEATVEPGGPAGSTSYLQVTDAGDGGVIRAIAPSAYLGSWAAFGPHARVSADVALLSVPAFGQFSLPVHFEISGPGGRAVKTFAYPPIGPWIHYETPIVESEWVVINGTWDTLVQNVTQFLILAEYATGFDVTGIDNVKFGFQYEVGWNTVDGGGTMVSFGDHSSLKGTIGQSDPGAMSENGFTLTGGFWPGATTSVRGDCDVDGDVDLNDTASFFACTNGPSAGIPVDCACWDLDGDLDVDLHDFAIVQQAFTGS